MQTVALTAATTMLPAFAALAAEDVTPIDLRLAAGYTIFLGRGRRRCNGGAQELEFSLSL